MTVLLSSALGGRVGTGQPDRSQIKGPHVEVIDEDDFVPKVFSRFCMYKTCSLHVFLLLLQIKLTAGTALQASADNLQPFSCSV